MLIRRRKGIQSVDEDAVRRLVAGAIDGLTAERVTVVQVQSAPTTASHRTFVHVGPVTVTAESAPALRGLVGGALGLALLMAIGLIWALRRRPMRT